MLSKLLPKHEGVSLTLQVTAGGIVTFISCVRCSGHWWHPISDSHSTLYAICLSMQMQEIFVGLMRGDSATMVNYLPAQGGQTLKGDFEELVLWVRIGAGEVDVI